MQLKTNIILLFVVIIVVVIVIILVVGAIVPGILEFQEKNVLYVEIVANIAINAWKDAVMVYVNMLKDVVNAFVMDVVNALMDVVNVFVMDVTVVANALKDVVEPFVMDVVNVSEHVVKLVIVVICWNNVVEYVIVYNAVVFFKYK